MKAFHSPGKTGVFLLLFCFIFKKSQAPRNVLLGETVMKTMESWFFQDLRCAKMVLNSEPPHLLFFLLSTPFPPHFP
jgi:hypothetical protein